MAAEIDRLGTRRRGLEHRLVDRARGALGALVALGRGVAEHGAAGEQHRHRVREVLAHQRGRGAVRGLGHRDVDAVVLVEAQEHRLGARDRPEHRQHEIAQAVAVSIQCGNHQW